MSLTAQDHRAQARAEDWKAVHATTATESRAHRRKANAHRLDAIMADYRLTIEEPPAEG